MPDTRETVEALVRAFNVNNRFSDTVETNFTLQSRGKKGCIVVSFDKDMDHYQCIRYLGDIKRKIIHEFYGIEEGDNKEILDAAKLIFDVKSFPFDTSKGKWSKEQDRVEFVMPIDQGVIFNLKSHLAFSLKKDVQEDMSIYITTKTFDRKKYLWHGEFPSSELRDRFENMFLSRVKERCENVPNGLLKVKGNDVYIRDAFSDVRFIDSIVRHTAWLVGRSLQANSRNRSDVKAFKDLIIEFIDQSTGLIVTGFMCAPFLNGTGASILIPVIQDNEEVRLLRYKEAFKINCAFGNSVFCNIYSKTQAELLVDGSSWIYGINFYDPHISHCVINKIIENSIINKNYELSIDPELHFRALSPSDEKGGGSPNSSVDETDTQQYSPRPSSEVGKLFPLQYNVDSSKSIGAAAVDADESEQEASDSGSEIDYAEKEYVLRHFISYLPLQDNKGLESTISELLPSLEGRERLYSALSSFPDREGIYVELRLSSDQIEQAELKWHLLHEQYEPPLTQLDSPRRSSGPFSPQQIIDLSKSMGAAAVGAGDEMMDSLKRLSPCNPGKLQSML